MTWAESLRREGAKEALKEGIQKGLEKGLQKGLQKGRMEGREEGRLIGQIVTHREHLGLPALPNGKLELMSVSELEQMAQELKIEARRRANSR